MYRDKRGVSPVIATVLLILVAIILFSIILWWVNQFIKEDIEKDLGGGYEPIDNFCKDVVFTADVEDDGTVTVQNNGIVPIYGIEVQKKRFASTSSLGEVTADIAVTSGDTQTFTNKISGVASTDNLILIPILRGEKDGVQKAYTCDESTGVEVKVI